MTNDSFPNSDDSIKYFESRGSHLQGLLAVWAVPLVGVVSAMNWLSSIQTLPVKILTTFAFVTFLLSAAFLHYCSVQANRTIMTLRGDLVQGLVGGTATDDKNTEGLTRLFLGLTILGLLGFCSILTVAPLLLWS